LFSGERPDAGREEKTRSVIRDDLAFVSLGVLGASAFNFLFGKLKN
jgi:hypothetical protein